MMIMIIIISHHHDCTKDPFSNILLYINMKILVINYYVKFNLKKTKNLKNLKLNI